MNEDREFRRPYRLLAVDVDGTLVNHEGHIHESDRKALTEAAANGVTVAIASGRMGESIRMVFDRLGLDGPLIGYNGAMVKRALSDGEGIVYHQPLRPEMAKSIVQFVYWYNAQTAEADQLHLNYYLEDRLYADRPCVWSDKYHRQTGSTFHFAGDLRQFDGQAPTKTILMTHPERRETFYELFQYRFGDGVCLAKTWPDYHLEIMDAGVNKGKALLALADHLGLQRSEVMTLGDGGNDIPMLELEGVFGVALGNATEEARAAADWVSRSCDEGGIAHALDRFLSQT